ncbi:MAG: hypothetical protein HY801_05300 [Candidatus Lindowbacteria bacterium]|nr:hypothetical protein [Candidatus Lindowbacteria bacterium]
MLAVTLSFKELSVLYDSPSQGMIEFGWRGNFRVSGKEISLRNRLRYDNRYSPVEFDPKVIEIRKDGEWLRLELDNFTRTCSSTV